MRLLVIFFFVLFLACKVCPDFGKQRLSFSHSCSCEPLYQDRATNKCYKYFKCPIFGYVDKFREEKAWDQLEYNEDVAVIVKSTVDALENYKEGNVVGKLFETQTLMALQQILKMKKLEFTLTELQNSEEYAFLRECIDSKWEGITKKHSAQVKSLFNPMLMKNKKLEQECQKNKICKFFYVLEKNKAGFAKNLARTIPDLCNTVIEELDEIKKKSTVFCRKHECKFLKELFKDVGLLKETLTNIVEEKQDFASTMVDVVFAGRRTLLMYASSGSYH